MLRVALIVSSVFWLTPVARAEPCELPEPGDCLQRGLELMQAGDPASVGWFLRACESKLPDGCAQMGFLYMGGPLLARDDAQAFAFSVRACDLGSGLGCSNAAVLTRDGRGAAPDDVAMKKLAERACKLEHGDGCFLVAAIIEEGRAGAKKPDPAKAIPWLEKACDFEDARSCELLANRYLEGTNGARRDVAKAAARFERACALGSGEACNDLGVAIGSGTPGFPKGGHDKAREVFARGCELGHEHACNNMRLAAAQGPAPAAAGSDAPGAREGTTELALDRRSGKALRARATGGAAPIVGAQGEVSKRVTQLGMTMNLVIGVVKITAIAGDKVELEVLSEQSEIIIDGKKVDHWTPGSALTLSWKTP